MTRMIVRTLVERDFTATAPNELWVTLETDTHVFFADPHSPRQRPTNENTSGVLLRQYFPKGADLTRWSATDLEGVAHTLNDRPRKVLGWKTPAEVFDEQLRSLDKPVSQRLVEPARYVAVRYTQRIGEAGVVASEAPNSLFKARDDSPINVAPRRTEPAIPC